LSQQTKNAIMESFIRLVGKKPLDKITVKDIVEDCDITRNTFYYHFQDVFDLMGEVFHSQFRLVMEREKEAGSWAKLLPEYIKFAQQNRSFLLHIYHSSHRDELERIFFVTATEYITQALRNYPEAVSVSDENLSLLARMLFHVLNGMLHEWMNSGMQEDPILSLPQMQKMLEDMVSAGLIAGNRN